MTASDSASGVKPAEWADRLPALIETVKTLRTTSSGPDTSSLSAGPSATSRLARDVSLASQLCTRAIMVAKGIRLNARQIREIAVRHQVPIIENKPLARLLFKHARVDGEVPAQLYAAVAEVLAWVYRINRYRYFSERNQA